jgi:hypothetical protein
MRFLISAGGAGGQAGFDGGLAWTTRAMLIDAFLPALTLAGGVERAGSAGEGVRRARRAGAGTVHLCFAYPHELPMEAGAETIPIFGLGLEACPDRPFGDDPASDWRARLRRAGRAACFSTGAAEAVRLLMGRSFPVAVTPPPVAAAASPAALSFGAVRLPGMVLDSASWESTGMALSASADPGQEAAACVVEADEPAEGPGRDQAPAWRKTARYRLGIVRLHARAAYREAVADLLPAPAARGVSWTARQAARGARAMIAPRLAGNADQPPGSDWLDGAGGISLGPSAAGGVVFAAVLGPRDEDWSDLLSAFIATFRADQGATLLICTGQLSATRRGDLAATIRRHGPFGCRIAILAADNLGWLDAAIAASHFVVCASGGEAVALPVMRFLAAGRPVVSPAHSALADLVDADTGFLVAAGRAYAAFPGDPREKLHGSAWRLDWESLCAGLAEARLCGPAGGAHAALAARACARIRTFCDPAGVAETLRRLAA